MTNHSTKLASMADPSSGTTLRVRNPRRLFFGMQGFPLTDARVRESVSTLETTGPNYRTPVFVDCTEGPSGLRRVGVLWFQAEEDLSWPWLPCEEQGLAGSPHAQIRAFSLGLRPGKPLSPGSTSSLVCGWSWKETITSHKLCHDAEEHSARWQPVTALEGTVFWCWWSVYSSVRLR